MQYRNIDKQALKENGYTVLSKITIVGTNTVFTEDDHIVNWIYEDYRYVPNNGFIGQFVERILDGNLQDISEDVVLEDTEINLQLGIVNGLDNDTTTWYDYGNFLITKVEKTDTTGNYKFESADYTKKFNKVFDGDYTDTTYTKSFNQKIEDEETVTALWLAQYVCAQAGVILNDTNFTNYSFVISSNQYDSEDTLRKVMQDIGKLAYSWVRVGEDNKVHIDFTPKTTSSVDQYDRLTTDEYYVSKKSDLTFGPVNKVLIGMSDVEGENLYVTSPDYTEETECAIKIYDNNLTNTEELRQIALNGASRLFGLTYTPVEINSVGHPWLDGDELIKLTNVDDVELYTYPFNRKLTYSGYIEGTIGAEAQTAQESKYEYKSDIISDVKKTSIIVDKQEQTITGLVENMKDIILETTIKKTEEGNPIEIYDAGSYPVEDFKIYGNAIQDGTPSVANPVEIQTLTSKEENENHSGVNIEFYNDTDNYSIENRYELDGDTYQYTTTGKNIYKKENLSNDGTGYTSETTLTNGKRITTSQSGTGYRFKSYAVMDLTNYVGKTIRVKCNFTSSSTNTPRYGIGLCNSSGGDRTMSVYSDTSGNTISFEVPILSGTKTYLLLNLYANAGGNATANSYVDYTDIIITIDNSNMNYEPYTGGIASPNPNYPQPINVVTGLQKINITGSNLFNEEWELGSIDVHGNETSSTTSIRSVGYTEVEPNTTYRITRTKTGYYPVLREYNASKTFVSVQTIFSGHIQDTSITFTTTNDTYYIRLVDTESEDRNKIMLTKGTQIVPYEPYKGNTYEINLGKNLFDYTTTVFSNPDKVEVETFDNTIKITTLVETTSGDLFIRTKIPDELLTNGQTYTISSENVSGVYKDLRLQLRNKNGSMASGQNQAVSLIYDNTYSLYVVQNPFAVSNSTVIPAGTVCIIKNVQVEKGDVATSFAEYFTPIELNKIGNYKDFIFKGKGINLFDGEIELGNINPSDGSLSSNNSRTRSKNYIKVKPNTTYTMKRSVGSSRWIIGYTKDKVGITDGGHNNYASALMSFGSIIMPQTFTTSATTEYIKWYDTNSTDLQEEVLLVEGSYTRSTIPPYEPYNAKDKWLLHKEIGKVVLDGSESWAKYSGTKRYYLQMEDILTPSTNNEKALIISNLFTVQTANYTSGATTVDAIALQTDGILLVRYVAYNNETLANFKTELNTNNIILYLPLATPTTNEIENEELINDLESIELLDGLNNIAITSSDLPGILNINQTKYSYQIIRIKDDTGMYNDYKLILKDVEYARVTDNRDYIYPENNKWYSYKIINKINSYNGETIDTDYISTTGELSTGATVYYVANEPNIQEIVDENILNPLNELKNTLLYNGYNKIELLNELVDKLSITYLTDSELNASYATKSELQITANNITTTVSETTTKVNELDEKIEEVNASISEQTSTSITDWFNTSLKSLIEDLETSTNNNSNEIINIQSYIRRGRITDETSPYYNQAYIELGDSTNQTTLRILQNRIQFLTNGEETAYISNNQLYINESTILTKEKIGHWVTTEDEDGLLNTYWEE